MMPHNSAHIFFEKSTTLEAPYRLGDDPRPLQAAFANLFDQAAQAIYLAGSDLDEVLIERILLMRREDDTVEVPASFIADAELLKKSIHKYFAATGGLGEMKEPEILAVKVIARQDRLGQS